MEINNDLSRKITILSSLSMLLVVMAHCIFGTANYFFSKFIDVFFFSTFIRVAVPVFFIISGFFFWKGYSSFSLNDYKIKIRKRVNNLLFPFLLYSLISIVFLYIGYLLPFSRPFFNGYNVLEFNLSDFINIILFKPFNAPLWFLRDLFLISLISPVIYLFLNKIKYLFLFSLFFLWLLDVNLHVFTIDGLFFFSIGSFLYYFPGKIKYQLKVSIKYMLLLYISFCIFMAIYIIYNPLDEMICRKILIFLSIPLFYNLLQGDFLLKKNWFTSFLLWFKTYSFICFCLHIIICQIYKKIINFIGFSDYIYLFIYFTVLILTIITCVLFQLALKKISPKLLPIFTGYRIK